MTRQEFWDNAIDMDKLMEICYEADLDWIRERYLDEEQYDQWAADVITEEIRYNGWQDAVRLGYDLPTGYYWYETGDGLEAWGIGDYEFEDIRREVEEALIDNDWFDPEEEEETEVEEEPEPEEVIEEPDDRPDIEGDEFNIWGLMDSSLEVVRQVKKEREEAQAELKEAFDTFFAFA